MNIRRISKLAAGLAIASAVVGVSAQNTSAAAPTPPTVAKTWTAMSMGYMPWGNNSGNPEFKQASGNGSWSTSDTNDLLMGNWFGSSWKSFTQFDPALFAGKTITKATLNLPISTCGSAKAGEEYTSPIHVRRNTSAFWYGQLMPGASVADEDITMLPVADDFAFVDITSYANVWNDKTKNFGLSFDLGSAENTFCHAHRNVAIGKVDGKPVDARSAFIEITYDVNPAFTNNGSFETGASSWRPCFNPKTVSYSTPSGWNAFDGNNVLRFNSTSGNGSMCQTKPRKPVAGDNYQMAVRVRSASGKPVNGTASLWELRPAAAGPSWETHVDFVATADWKEYRTSACSRNAEATSLKAEILVATANQNLDVDVVEVSIGNPSICGVAPTSSTTTTSSTTSTTTTTTTTAKPVAQ
jgi:hypothetical protein